MTFKEFTACDGRWGMVEAMVCIDLMAEIRKLSFWKREKFWRELYEKHVLDEIVEPINQKILIDQLAARIPHTDQATTHEKEHSTMTINEYQALALRTESRITTDPVPYIRVLEGLMGLNGELRSIRCLWKPSGRKWKASIRPVWCRIHWTNLPWRIRAWMRLSHKSAPQRTLWSVFARSTTSKPRIKQNTKKKECLELCNSSSGHLCFLERGGMKGIYQSVPDCIACMNLGWAPEGACSGCLRLAKERAEEVGILQLGVGLFADKAVIKKTNGALATVPMSELTIID